MDIKVKIKNKDFDTIATRLRKVSKRYCVKHSINLIIERKT